MALAHSPKIVKDGLVLHIDSANPKCYDGSENLMESSEAFVTWGFANCTVSSNVVLAPDRTKTADAIIASAADVGHYFTKSATGTTLSDTIYTFSIYLKHKGFDLLVFQPTFKDGTYQNIANWNLATKTATATGDGIAATIEELDDGWFRVTSTFNSKTGASQIAPLIYIGTYGNILGDGVKGVYAWGAQLERGAKSSKYKKTTTAAIPRSTTISDLSSNNNNGTLFNSPTFVDDALEFNGTNQYIDFGDKFSYAVGSIEFWFNLTTSISIPHSGNVRPWGKHTDFEARWGGGTTTSGASLAVDLGASIGPPASLQSIQNSWLNTSWYNVVITWNTTTLTSKMYIQGSLDTTGTCTAAIPSLTGSFFVGRSTTAYFPGKISVFKVYNRELTSDEVQQNFNAVRGRYGL